MVGAEGRAPALALLLKSYLTTGQLKLSIRVNQRTKDELAQCQRHHDYHIALKMHRSLFQNSEKASLELSAFQRASLLPTSQGSNMPSSMVTLRIQTVRNVWTRNATLTLAEWPGNCGTEQPHHTSLLILAHTSCIWHSFFLWFISLSIYSAEWNAKFISSSCLITFNAKWT